MPDGRVMRIDEDRGCVYVARRGRTYEAPLSEVETAARVPGARVRYKLRRQHGVESAEQVELRSGTRTNKRQRRFGDLSGARAPGTKVKTSAQHAYGIDVTTQPFRVVGAWLSAMEAQDLDAATEFYLPGAVVHLDVGPSSGRPRIRALLEESPWLAVESGLANLTGRDRYVRAEVTSGDVTLVAYFIVADGYIVEQWLGPEPPTETIEETTEVEVVLRHGVAPPEDDSARQKLEGLLASIGSGARRPQMKLSQTTNPNRPIRARAEAKLDYGGTVLRAHATAATITEAIDLVVDRMKNSLEHHQDSERHQSVGLQPDRGSWRHDNLALAQPPHFDRQLADREIVRHKSFGPDEATVDEAIWDMGLLDYDFYLFVELTTGLDCLLEQTSDGELVVHVLPSADRSEVPRPDGVRHSTVVPSVLPLSEALVFLDESGQRFLFFKNALTLRGNVLYRRYDGHYGLITPPSDDE